MSAGIWNLVRAMAGAEAGRSCRRCADAIAAKDAFGMSEGVCRPCRVAAGN